MFRYQAYWFSGANSTFTLSKDGKVSFDSACRR